ncbi:MAG: TetR/AcrR family transcriptional regulator [Rhizobiaceae bacterium]|nr:TetR/AcrR family transcriptional regulator [Rhizobiaceae bacterium]MCV0408150.1 TetR/AcrR family transcriptional regulator [Rhizobiaceae bacterium]
MGRKRSFDEEAVLAGAMMAFRRHGYAGLSVKELEAATRISAGSLYNAYGDKEGLYRAVFDFYFRKVIDHRIGAAQTLDDLEKVALDLFNPPFSDGFGCLVTNAAVEFRNSAGTGGSFAGRGLDTIEAAALRAVRADMGDGHEHAALRIVLLYQGMLVLTRAGRLSNAYKDAVRAEFDRLRTQAKSTSPAIREQNEKGD